VKEKYDIKCGARNQSEGDKSVQNRKKGKQSVVKAGHQERAVVRGNGNPGLSDMEMDVTDDEDYGGLVMATGGVRRSGRIKRARTNSEMEETGFERAKRARTAGQGKAASTSTSISSQVNRQGSGESMGRTRRMKNSSRGRGKWE
jgi:hypothetical protein